jgi:hypothetical protein
VEATAFPRDLGGLVFPREKEATVER